MDTTNSALFFQRFSRPFDLRVKHLLQGQSLEVKDGTDKAPLSRRPKITVPKCTASVYSQALPRNKRLLAKRKLPQNEISTISAKPPENDTSLGNLSQMASDLRTMFSQMPRPPRAEPAKHESKAPSEARRTPEKHPSPKPIPPGYSALPRISASSTPRRQPVPPSDTARSKSQHRPKVSSRRGKDPVDMTNFQQFFAEFHQKSRNLLQRLEANVLGK